jgi:hypothetical protein
MITAYQALFVCLGHGTTAEHVPIARCIRYVRGVLTALCEKYR